MDKNISLGMAMFNLGAGSNGRVVITSEEMSRMDILSTNAAAELLGVSEATIKRWSDAGTLPCFRTAGGHRKFRLRDLQAFLSHQDPRLVTSRPPPPIAPRYELTDKALELRQYLFEGDGDSVVSMITANIDDPMQTAVLFDTIVMPTLKDLRESNRRNKLSQAQEHIVFGTLIMSLRRMGVLMPKKARRTRAYCVTLRDESAEPELRMISILLDGLGHKVAYVRGTLSSSDFAVLLSTNPPNHVVLWGSEKVTESLLLTDLGIITSACAVSKISLRFGGQGYPPSLTPAGQSKRFLNFGQLVESFQLVN